MKFSPPKIGPFKYLAITVILLLIPIGFYFLFHVPAQKDYFTSRNLRLLGAMSQNISKIIKSYKDIIDNITINNKLYKENKFRRTTANDIELDIENFEEYIDERINEIINLKLSYIRISTDTNSLESLRHELSPARLQQQTKRHEFSQITYKLKPEGYDFKLTLRYLGLKQTESEKAGNYTVNIEAHSSLAGIIKPLIPAEIFDNILLVQYADSTQINKVIYQDRREEFVAIHLDSLALDIKQTGASHHQNIIWGNTRYKLYVQPVRIAVLNDGTPQDQQQILKWMLIGLVEAEKFSSQSRAISQFKISIFVFLVLLVLISIPLFKLHFIGAREEIKRADILFTALALFIGAAMLTFLLLSVYSNHSIIHDLDYALGICNDSLASNLNAEIDDVIAQYHALNDSFAPDTTKRRINSILSDSGYSYPDIQSLPYPYVTQIAWIADNGWQVWKVGTRSTLTPLVDLNHRPYFQNIKNNSGWTRSIEDTSAKQDFFIESIISITTGKNEAILSMPPVSNDTIIATSFEQQWIKDTTEAVVAITAKFNSIFDVIMPHGFGFCIINNDGEVLFHHEQNKNLQENFFTECDNNPKLHAAVFSRTEKKLYVNYLGTEHRLCVKPVKNFPWTLITFADLNYVRASEQSALVNSTLLFAILLLIFIGFLLILKIPKKINWLSPQKDLNHKYQLLIVFLSTIAGVYYFFIFNSNESLHLTIALFIPIIISSIFLTIKIKVSLLNRLSKYILPQLLLLIICIAFSFLLTRYFWYYGIIGLAIGLVLVSDKITKLTKLPAYYTRYAICGVAFLVVTSVLPAIVFFKIAYDSELELFIKQGQLSLLKSIEHRKTRVKQEIDLIELDDNNKSKKLINQRLRFENANDIYSDFFYRSFVSLDTNFVDLLKNNITARYDPKTFPTILSANDTTDMDKYFQPEKTSQVDSSLAFFRSRAKIVRSENWEIYNKMAADSSWLWKKYDDRLLRLEKKLNNKKNTLFIVSYIKHFDKPDTMIWYGGMPMMFMFLFFVFIYLIRKVFAIDMILPTSANALDFTSNQDIQNTIFIGPPNSGKTKLMEHIEHKHIIDFRQYDKPDEILVDIQIQQNFNKKFKQNYNIFIIDHFDLQKDDDEWTLAKLNIVENLISVHKKTVVIVTTVDPIKFISQQIEHNKVDSSFLDRWIITLSSFRKVYHNIQTDDKEFENFIETKFLEKVRNISTEQKRQKLKLLRNTILAECHYTPFLRSVGKQIFNNFDPDKDDFHKDILLHDILQSCETYYQSIWTTCSIEEKIILIQVAKNGFVTPKDADVVNILMHKGFILKQGGFKLFNKSFKKFVLAAESSTDIKQWKKQQEKSWINVRTPLLTVFIALVLFIFITQQETFNESMAWISAFLAGIPALIRFFSLLRPGFKQIESTSD